MPKRNVFLKKYKSIELDDLIERGELVKHLVAKTENAQSLGHRPVRL